MRVPLSVWRHLLWFPRVLGLPHQLNPTGFCRGGPVGPPGSGCARMALFSRQRGQMTRSPGDAARRPYHLQHDSILLLADNHSGPQGGGSLISM